MLIETETGSGGRLRARTGGSVIILFQSEEGVEIEDPGAGPATVETVDIDMSSCFPSENNRGIEDI